MTQHPEKVGSSSLNNEDIAKLILSLTDIIFDYFAANLTLYDFLLIEIG